MSCVSRIVEYYQDPDDLSKLSPHVTDLILCSIHFGPNYMHLNNYDCQDPKNAPMWYNIEMAEKKGVNIWLMVGGAGGAFQTMFQDFTKYYNMLHNLIILKPYITGIDLDVEENVDLVDIQKLIMKLKLDFPAMKISFAPITHSLAYPDEPGMGNFCYGDLDKTMGKYIDEYHVQMYNDFSTMALTSILKHFHPQRIVAGMNSTQNMQDASDQIKDMQVLTNHTLQGIFIWNYHLKPPKWEQIVYDALYSHSTSCFIQ